MNVPSIHTVVFSPTGTSKKIAQAVARGFVRNAFANAPSASFTSSSASAATKELSAKQVDLTYATAAPTEFAADAIVIFALPVYGGHPAPTALERMKELRGKGTPAVVIAVYGNRDIGTAATELAQAVAAQGFIPIAAGAFVGEHSYSTASTPIAPGRPDSDDLARAEAFGVAIRIKLDVQGPTPIDTSRLRIPRTPLLPLMRFVWFVVKYRNQQKRQPKILLPEGDAYRCSHCGRCVALCPTQAIVRGDELHTDPARCIRCNACIKTCPIGARTFQTPFGRALSRNFGLRKEPVTLL